jgi:transposase
MEVTTLGIDLAKNVFCVHGSDANGKPVLRKNLSRRQLLSFVANLPRCLVAMEACASAHYWAREIGLHPNFPPIIGRDRGCFRPPGAVAFPVL